MGARRNTFEEPEFWVRRPEGKDLYPFLSFPCPSRHSRASRNPLPVMTPHSLHSHNPQMASDK